ncbi:class A beta-lactamase [Chryseolinea sp. T2]|uniref:class A beta-lactamase n=1 Tax=Chryseolinea sp. T2 TaxID=3129255 RepID=UPI0030772972
MSIRLSLLCIVLFIGLNATAQKSLRNQIGDIAESISGDVGVAMRLIERGDTLSYHGAHPFPMQSTYKFQLALQVMTDVDNGKLSLDQKVFISKDEYFQTHSPLMKEHPDGNINLTVGEVLKYMIEWSDNVACDILFKLVGGPKRVDLLMNSKGIKDMAIRNTEREMHGNDQLQYQNWTTPQVMVHLLSKFYTSDILSEKSRKELWNLMVITKTGPKRLRGMLPDGTVVANRTGTGNITKDRRVSAVNDVGIIELPNGEHLAIAVYITNTHEEIPEAEEVIASIAKAAFDHFGAKGK